MLFGLVGDENTVIQQENCNPGRVRSAPPRAPPSELPPTSYLKIFRHNTVIAYTHGSQLRASSLQADHALSVIRSYRSSFLVSRFV